MAIAKMNKVMLIAPTEKQNDLLDAIQELQSLEVTSLEQAKELFTQKSIVLKDADEQEVNTLQKGKDNAKEVTNGMECGITLLNCQDYKEQDIIEIYELVKVEL